MLIVSLGKGRVQSNSAFPRGRQRCAREKERGKDAERLAAREGNRNECNKF